MKIFWSWQSNTPGSIGRHFVRDALDQAIQQIKEIPTIEEAVRESIHLDHDRKGVAGSPDLAATIYKKISGSAVFVADVTPVGKSENERPLLNSNVAIELGYALACLGDSKLLMVLNEYFGQREDLPFDLRHKAGPITFNLAAGADLRDRKETLLKLSSTFRRAITECLQSPDRPRAYSDVSDRPLTILGLPTRLTNALLDNGGFATVGDLVYASRRTLLYTRGVGHKGIEQIAAALEARGLQAPHLKGKRPGGQ